MEPPAASTPGTLPQHLNRDDERLDAMPIAPLMRQRFHAHADLVPHRIRAVAPVVRRAIAPAATGVAQCRHAKGLAQIGFHLHCLGTWNAVVGLHGFHAGRVVLAAAAVFQSRRLPAHCLQEILAFDIRSRQAIRTPLRFPRGQRLRSRLLRNHVGGEQQCRQPQQQARATQRQPANRLRAILRRQSQECQPMPCYRRAIVCSLKRATQKSKKLRSLGVSWRSRGYTRLIHVDTGT